MPSSTEKKVLAQALESVKDQVSAEGDLSGEEDARLVAQIDLREYLQVKYNRPLEQDDAERWQAPRQNTRSRLQSGPGLCLVDCQPRAQGALGAQLPELCQGSFAQSCSDPRDKGVVSGELGQGMGVPSREGPASQDGEEQEARRLKQGQSGHEHRGGPHGVDAQACAAARVAEDRRTREASAAAVEAAPGRVRAVKPSWTRSPEESESWDATTVALCDQIDGRIREIESALQSQIEGSHQSQYVMPALDVLEITAGVGNAVSTAIKQRGGRAMVYNQVKNIEGRPGSAERLWKIIKFYEPDMCGLTSRHHGSI